MLRFNPEIRRFGTFISRVKQVVYETFAPDGVDYVLKTQNGRRDVYRLGGAESSFSFRKRPLTLITSFLGLPNRLLKGTDQSFLNLVKNFVGWRPDTSIFKLFLFALIVTPINLLTTPLKFALNITKLVTEVLPAILHLLVVYSGVSNLGKRLQAYGKNLANRQITAETSFSYAKFALGYYLEKLGALLKVAVILPTYLLYFIGRNLTSPIDSIRDTWYLDTPKDGRLNRPARTREYVLTALHVAFIFMLYSIALPLTVKLLATNVLPYISSHLPPVLLAAFNNLGTFFAPILSKIGVVTLELSRGASLFLVDKLGLTAIAAAMPEIAGLGAVAAFGLISVGNVINEKINDFRNEWWGYKVSSDPFTTAILDNTYNTKASEDSYNKSMKSWLAPIRSPKELQKTEHCEPVLQGLGTAIKGELNKAVNNLPLSEIKFS